DLFEAGGDFDSELAADDRDVLDALLADLWRAELAAAEPAWARFLAQKRLTPSSLRQRLRGHLGKPYLRIEPRDAAPGDLAPACDAWEHARSLWLRDGASCLAELAAFDGLNKRSYDAARFALWHSELDAYFADPAALFAPPAGLEKLAREALAKGCKKGFDLPDYPLCSALQGLVDALEAAKPAGEARLIALQVRLLDTLNRELPQRKAAQRLLAFDDLLNRLDEALQGEAGDALAAALRERYPVALIDEFQDTDPVQYAIFRRVYPGGEAGGDLCFVGDPKQAIYAFRGADLATYLKARDEAARQYSLATNHRSVPRLIAALNRVFDRPRPFAEPGLDYPPVGASDKPRAQLVLPEGGAPLELVWLGDEPLGKGEAGRAVPIDTARR
uniref:UvrD-helicase domain-containing protein n=1 Tax=Metapseudomonas otitidis TaxID=319939 RepID=UPI0013F6063D